MTSQFHKTIALAAALLAPAPAALGAAQIDIIVLDGPNEGFNDSTPVPPVAGNPGTTLGEQRLNAFRAAADVWEAVLDSTVPITVEAEMNPLTPCSATAGVLGRAGPNQVFRDFTGAPQANTWYPGALANRLAGSDQDPAVADIGAEFNSDVDDDPGCLTGVSWWYGIGTAAPPNTIAYFDTVLHEIAHGLGVLTFVDPSNGQRFLSRDDMYMKFLEDHSTGTAWPAMTDAQRAASAIDTADLHWTGTEVNNCVAGWLTSGAAGGHARMYAPNPVEPGSSVSHFDTALTPDELMEPFATTASDHRLTDRLLADIGWEVTTPPCTTHTPILSHFAVSSPHRPILSHFTVASPHQRVLSHFQTSSMHSLLRSHFATASRHDPVASHFAAVSGHDLIQSGGHDLIQSGGHGVIQSQGHNFIQSQGHDLVQSGGHSAILSGGGHSVILSDGGHNAVLSQGGHNQVASAGGPDLPGGPGGGPFRGGMGYMSPPGWGWWGWQ